MWAILINKDKKPVYKEKQRLGFKMKFGDIFSMSGKDYRCIDFIGDCAILLETNGISLKGLTGEEIIGFIRKGKFKEGDLIIASQRDTDGEILTSTYEYTKAGKCFEFVDVEYEDCTLEAFDLIYCTFEIVDMDQHKKEKIEKLQKERAGMLEEVKLIEKEIQGLSKEPSFNMEYTCELIKQSF